MSNFLTGQYVQLVYFDSFNFSEVSPPAGRTMSIGEEVPRGMKRRFTFGNVTQMSGTARNFQMFVVDALKKRYPLSALDTSAKGLNGIQVLKQMEHIEISVVAAADAAEIAGSVSYEDYLVRQ